MHAPRAPARPSLTARALACATALTLLAACAPESAPPPRRSLLLVTLDTTRADRLGAYGHAAARTPVFDALAERGVLFERAWAPTPVTLPSHASILTGVLPPAHGVRNNTLYRAAPEGLLVSEVLAERGWHTAAFVGAFVLAPKFGLDQGFDTYTAPDPSLGQGLERPAGEVVDDALAWLATLPADEPWFAWVHLYDAHSPYEPPQGFDDLADPYDGEIAYADAQLGRLLEGIERTRAGESLAVVVTADHGEALGQHGEETHGVFVYDETMRVPLVVLSPDAGELAGQRVEVPVSVRDVAPALLELAGLSAGLLPEADSESLLAVARGAAGDATGDAAGDARAIYLESLLPYLHHRWQPLTGLVLDGHKLIDTSRPELYDLEADPGETRDLAAEQPARVASMQARLRRLVERNQDLGWSARQGLDDEDRERLAALGYVGTAGADERVEDLPLPRERVVDLPRKRDATIRLTAALEQSVTAPTGAAGDEQRAEARAELSELRAIFRELLAAHPDEPSSLGSVAQTEAALGDLPAALLARQRQAALSPLDPRVHFAVADLHARLGEHEPAMAAMRAAAALEPQLPAAFRWLARAHAERGEYGHAEGWLRALDDIWWDQGPRRDDLRREIIVTAGRRERAGQALVMPE